MTAHVCWDGKDTKTKADLLRGTSGRDNRSEVPTFPRNHVVEKSKWKNRKYKTWTLWSGMVEFDNLEEAWGYNKVWCTAMT